MNKEMRREEVVKLYLEQNKSINQIAKELNISWETVKKDLILKNIEINKNTNQYSKGNGINDQLFSIIDNSDSAYWLGFLYADGSIRKDRNEITLDLKESDLETIKNFHEFCGNKNSIREHIIRKNGKIFKSYISSFSNKKVKENLSKLGYYPKKSLILTFPTKEQVPDEFIYDFVRGYVDGDGYIEFDLDKKNIEL